MKLGKIVGTVVSTQKDQKIETLRLYIVRDLSVELEEKPSYSFLANSGFYILNKEILGLIPHNKFYNINQLLDVIKKTKLKVGVFKISDNAWIDTGQWSEPPNFCVLT